MVRPIVVTEDMIGSGCGPDRTARSVTDWLTLARAVADAGANQTDLIVDRIERVTADLTIPDNVRLWFYRGGRIEIAAGVTLTIASPHHVQADASQHIFEGLTSLALDDGRVAFAAGGTAWPGWWGAVGDGVTDDMAAIHAADIAAGASGSVLFFPAGTYLISGSIACNAREYLGDGARNSLIVQSKSSTPIFYHTGGTALGDRKWRRLGFATSAAAVTDVAAFKSELPSSAYMSYCTWEDCEFYRGLKYGIHANLIFATINRCRFGYLDNFAESWNEEDVHVALWSPGAASKYSNINHVQESQFFCAKGGAAAVVLSVGTNWLFTSCDWELLDAPAVYAAGIFGLTFRNCHFERITPAGGEEYLVYGTTSTITTRPVVFDSCIISLQDSAGVTAIYEGSSASNTYTEFKRCVIWFDDKYLTKVGSKHDEGVGRLENNLFYDYAGILNVASRDDYARPVVAREGLLADPWLTGWALTNLQGWSKAAITSWGRGSYDGYPGGTIAYTTSAGGYNFMYVTLPAAEYRGKRIGIQGIATRATGTAAVLRLGYNFTEVTPTSMTQLEGGFDKTTPVSLYREVEVPADADYVHVGFASGGWAGTGHIIAFNVWEVQATSPTPALVAPAVWGTSHDYDAGTAAWEMTATEAAASLFTVTNAGGAADAVFPAAVPGKQFSVYNNAGAAITFKVSGQAGAATTTGKYSVWTMNGTDCVLIYEQP